MTDLEYAKKFHELRIEFDNCKECYDKDERIFRSWVYRGKDRYSYYYTDENCSFLIPNPSEEELSERLFYVIFKVSEYPPLKKTCYELDIHFKYDFETGKTFCQLNYLRLCDYIALFEENIECKTEKECKQKAIIKLSKMELLK